MWQNEKKGFRGVITVTAANSVFPKQVPTETFFDKSKPHHKSLGSKSKSRFKSLRAQFKSSQVFDGQVQVRSQVLFLPHQCNYSENVKLKLPSLVPSYFLCSHIQNVVQFLVPLRMTPSSHLEKKLVSSLLLRTSSISECSVQTKQHILMQSNSTVPKSY